MRRHAFVFALIAVASSTSGPRVSGLHGGTTRSVVPSASEAQTLLNATTRHREWVNI